MPYLGEEPDWAEGVHGALASLLRHLAPMDSEVQSATGVSIGVRQAVLRMIERRLTDPELSVGALAQALCVSRRTVQRVFTGARGSASTYILHRRLQMAAERLAGGARGETITGIALACGFADAAHFARCFRARFGRTPSAFRVAPSAVGEVGEPRNLLSDPS
jgi:AraC-like DNA-binding protein